MNANLKNIIVNYLKTQPVERAWLFGSFSRGEEREDSDVDILVDFEKDAKIGFRYFGMICDLEEMLRRPVDLVVSGSILPFAKDSINRDKVLIYERTGKG
jgi:hypothetical protein